MTRRDVHSTCDSPALITALLLTGLRLPCCGSRAVLVLSLSGRADEPFGLPRRALAGGVPEAGGVHSGPSQPRQNIPQRSVHRHHGTDRAETRLLQRSQQHETLQRASTRHTRKQPSAQPSHHSLLPPVDSPCVPARVVALCLGDYNAYVKTHDEQLRNRRHEYEVQQKKIAELKQFIEEAKKSDNEGTMNLQKTRQKQLDKMELVPEPPQQKDFKFTFPDPGPLDHAMLEVNDMSFTYQQTREKDTHWLLRHVNLNMDHKARVGILGVNGAGSAQPPHTRSLARSTHTRGTKLSLLHACTSLTPPACPVCSCVPVCALPASRR